MVRISTKKGAVELSLNLIIMLIIGMVVLGLVIGFVNSLVNKGTESFDKQLGDNEKLKLDEVRACSENLCVNPSPSMAIKRGGKQNLFIKVRAYDEVIDCRAGDLEMAGCSVTYKVLDEFGDQSSELIVTGPGFYAPEGIEDAQMYTLSAKNSAPVGIYYLTIGLYGTLDNPEIRKTITIEIS